MTLGFQIVKPGTDKEEISEGIGGFRYKRPQKERPSATERTREKKKKTLHRKVKCFLTGRGGFSRRKADVGQMKSTRHQAHGPRLRRFHDDLQVTKNVVGKEELQRGKANGGSLSPQVNNNNGRIEDASPHVS